MKKMCSYCEREDKTTNTKCEFCSRELILKEPNDSMVSLKSSNIDTSENKLLKIIRCGVNTKLFLSLGIFILVGIIFTIVGLCLYISEHNQTKNYHSTKAILKDYTNCEYNTEDDEEWCEAIYEYQVDGITYNVSPKQLSSRGGFKKEKRVYYNPNNPSDAIIYAGWESLLITGVMIIIVIVIIFIVSNMKLSKLNKVEEK